MKEAKAPSWEMKGAEARYLKYHFTWERLIHYLMTVSFLMNLYTFALGRPSHIPRRNRRAFWSRAARGGLPIIVKDSIVTIALSGTGRSA
jgi:hypothetical protein